MILDYGSSNERFAGSHDIELDVRLQNYTDAIFDDSARFNVTLYEITNDLSMEDLQYDLLDNVAFDVPKIIMNPPLHQTDNFGENGAEITIKVLIKHKKSEPYQVLRDNLATMNMKSHQLIFDSAVKQYIGLHWVRI